MVVPDYVISPFECAIELTDLEPNLSEQLFKLHVDLEVRALFTRGGFCTVWSSVLVTKWYAKLSEAVLGFLLAFPNSFMIEAGITHINTLLTKQQSRLDVSKHGDIRLKLTYLQPNIHELIKCHQLHPSHEMFFLGKLLNICCSLLHAMPYFTISYSTTQTSLTIFYSLHPVTITLLHTIIKSSKPTSCALDPIPTSLLLQCLDDILPTLTHFINTSILSGQFPTNKKTAIVKPLLKMFSRYKQILKL